MDHKDDLDNISDSSLDEFISKTKSDDRKVIFTDEDINPCQPNQECLLNPIYLTIPEEINITTTTKHNIYYLEKNEPEEMEMDRVEFLDCKNNLTEDNILNVELIEKSPDVVRNVYHDKGEEEKDKNLEVEKNKPELIERSSSSEEITIEDEIMRTPSINEAETKTNMLNTPFHGSIPFISPIYSSADYSNTHYVSYSPDVSPNSKSYPLTVSNLVEIFPLADNLKMCLSTKDVPQLSLLSKDDCSSDSSLDDFITQSNMRPTKNYINSDSVFPYFMPNLSILKPCFANIPISKINLIESAEVYRVTMRYEDFGMKYDIDMDTVVCCRQENIDGGLPHTDDEIINEKLSKILENSSSLIESEPEEDYLSDSSLDDFLSTTKDKFGNIHEIHQDIIPFVNIDVSFLRSAYIDIPAVNTDISDTKSYKITYTNFLISENIHHDYIQYFDIPKANDILVEKSCENTVNCNPRFHMEDDEFFGIIDKQLRQIDENFEINYTPDKIRN